VNASRDTNRVLVTGSQGYVGTELLNRMVSLDIPVTGTDVGYFRESKLDDSIERDSIKVDLRDQVRIDLSNYDCVVHLAALSNDPLGEINPSLTYVINRDCAIELATRAKSQGVQRFIFASTQSIYGISNSNDELGEEATKNPITAYAKSKWDAEQEILGLANKDFIAVAVRPSTIFGWGSRIRNDIVFNNMIASGIRTGQIDVHSDGTPCRPIVHISDVVEFLTLLLVAPMDIVSGQAYNLGSMNGNYTVREIAEAASRILGGIPINFNTENLNDQRSYRVSFDKARRQLGFIANKGLDYGGLEILEEVEGLTEINKQRYLNETTRLATLKRLLDSGRLNSDLMWI